MQFNAETIRIDLATMPCRNCGAEGGVATVEEEGTPHFARIECRSCGYWIDWLGWPPEKPSDRKRHRRITRLGDDHCELCLRTRFQLPAPEELQPHHVIEHGDGGSEDDTNIRWYCSSCHALVHWTRTYFGHYHPSGEEAA